MKKQLGKLTPRYRVFFNPYKYERLTTCPQCRNKTRLRKYLLLIHVDPVQLVMLYKPCRYCPLCDLLIIHKHEIEDSLTKLLTARIPELVGNDHLVVGTIDRADLKRMTPEQLIPPDIFEILHDFKEAVIFELTGGWSV